MTEWSTEELIETDPPSLKRLRRGLYVEKRIRD